MCMYENKYSCIRYIWTYWSIAEEDTCDITMFLPGAVELGGPSGECSEGSESVGDRTQHLPTPLPEGKCAHSERNTSQWYGAAI